MKNIVKSIPVCLFWKDVNGVYTGCNVRFASAAGGSSPNDIVGKTNHDLCWSKDTTAIWEWLVWTTRWSRSP